MPLTVPRFGAPFAARGSAPSAEASGPRAGLAHRSDLFSRELHVVARADVLWPDAGFAPARELLGCDHAPGIVCAARTSGRSGAPSRACHARAAHESKIAPSDGSAGQGNVPRAKGLGYWEPSSRSAGCSAHACPRAPPGRPLSTLQLPPDRGGRVLSIHAVHFAVPRGTLARNELDVRETPRACFCR
jgi:hypothetical protein